MMRPTSTFLSPNKRPSKRNRKSGATLVELLIYMAVSFAILGMVVLLYNFDIQHSLVTFQYAHSSVSIQKTAFMITKYLHNAKSVKIYHEPTNKSTPGNYVFLKGNSVYQVSVSDTTSTSTLLIASRVASLTFLATSEKKHLVVTVKVVGYIIQGKRENSVDVKTDVALNNVLEMSAGSTTSGTVLFYTE